MRIYLNTRVIAGGGVKRVPSLPLVAFWSFGVLVQTQAVPLVVSDRKFDENSSAEVVADRVFQEQAQSRGIMIRELYDDCAASEKDCVAKLRGESACASLFLDGTGRIQIRNH